MINNHSATHCIISEDDSVLSEQYKILIFPPVRVSPECQLLHEAIDYHSVINGHIIYLDTNL